jgi:aspartate/methionine/tyrosine aminotransferase
MNKGAERLKYIEEYYFSRKLREVKDLINNGAPIINMGIGSPDLDPPVGVVNSIKESLKHKNAHQYQSYKGINDLRIEISNFYSRFYNIKLNAEENILPLLGSKEGIMHISLALLNPGDEVLIPDPGYPTYSSVTKIVGATPRYYNLDSKNNWYPDIDNLQSSDISKVKLMWINYPHMPTGTPADISSLNDIVLFTQKNNIILVNDNPYSQILNDNPVSILNINNSFKNCLELNSLSKMFNMAGWRVGMVLGSKEYIENILKIKSNMDSGMFYGVQVGAINALKSDKDWFYNLNNIYKKRREIIYKICDKLNLEYRNDSVGMFVWAKIKNKTSSEKLSNFLLYKKNIFVAPGFIFGKNGEGYVRFSLCINESQINEALKRLT